MSEAVRPPPAPEPPDGGGGETQEWSGSQVLPHLFLGDLQAGTNLEDLQRLGITAVVNCTYEEPNFHEDAGILYHRVRLFDDTMQALTPERHLEPASAFIGAGNRCHAYPFGPSLTLGRPSTRRGPAARRNSRPLPLPPRPLSLRLHRSRLLDANV